MTLAIILFAATYVLMIGGTMGLVQLFIDSHMPERMAAVIPAYIVLWILYGV